MIQDHEPIQVSNFGGLYSRDSFYDSVPADHFIDALNVITFGDELRTRFGFQKSFNLANIRQYEVYKREGEADRAIILVSGGDLFDTTYSLVTPILSLSDMTGFACLTFYNRLYISPHNGNKGLPGDFLYVYQGSGSARKAAGVKPSGGFNVGNSVTAGNVEEGLHILAVVYETDSGFVTPPGPTAFPTITADGTHKLDIANIPVGPTGTSKRRLLASRAIQDYNGDQDGYELFFVPDGTINDNTTTILTINFYDAELQISADYLFDQLDEIPAGVFLCSYAGKLIIGGEDQNPSMARVSKNNEPESINELAGFIICDPFETEGLKSAVEFRNNLYLMKGNPGHTYTTKDNGYDASTWYCPATDNNVGADVNGIAQILDNRGANSKYFLVADTSGIFLYDGAYGDNPITWKIDNIWERINKAVINTLKIIVDPKAFLIYVIIPLDSATSPNYILVGDYSNGIGADNIRWWLWNFNSLNPVGIAIRLNSTTKKAYLSIANYSGNVYNQVDDTYNDEDEVYTNYARFAMLYEKESAVHSFTSIGLRITGSGTLGITAFGLDDVTTATLPDHILGTSPGQEYHIPMLLTNEKCSIKIRLSTINKYFRLRMLSLYANVVFNSRPYNG